MFVAALLLGMLLIHVRPGAALLMGGDAGCYARVSSELAARPVSDWARLTLGGAEFFEHPPLWFWVEAAAFRAFGESPLTAVECARWVASLALLLSGLLGRRLGATHQLADETGALVMLGLVSLPGFLYSSQVAMLEIPLTAALAWGGWALAARSSTHFALALTAGFFIKGPPVALLLGLCAGLVVLRQLSMRDGMRVALPGVLVLVLAVVGFDTLRRRLGLEPFFQHYLVKQVLASMVEGRHNPNADPWFYVVPTWNWYLPACVASVVGLVAAKRQGLARTLYVWGALAFAGVIVGFTLMRQKYQWYIHPAAVGGALLVASVALAVPLAWLRRAPVALAVIAVGWVAAAQYDWPLTESQQRIAAVQHAVFPEQFERVVADCSGAEAWASGHLMGFVWRARRVECDEPAPVRWTGTGFQPK